MYQKLMGLLVVAFAALLPQTLSAQTLRGVVTDAISGEALIGATVKLVEADKGASETEREKPEKETTGGKNHGREQDGSGRAAG